MTVIVLDCNGVLADSKSKLVAASIRWIENSFSIGLEREKAKEIVRFFSGETFEEGLRKTFQSLFPQGCDQGVFQQGSEELLRIIEETYRKIEPFPEVIETLRQLEERFRLVVSSTLEKTYLDIWLSSSGIAALFEGIYGGENGKKESHIQMLREKYPQEGICFVGNSPYEMKLGDASIGIARQLWERQPLRRAGANAIISSLDQVSQVIGLLGH